MISIMLYVTSGLGERVLAAAEIDIQQYSNQVIVIARKWDTVK